MLDSYATAKSTMIVRYYDVACCHYSTTSGGSVVKRCNQCDAREDAIHRADDVLNRK